MGNARSTPCTIEFPEGTAFGESHGTVLGAEALSVTPAVFEDKPMVLLETVLLPEEKVAPVMLVAPLTPEQKSHAEQVWAGVCLLETDTITDADGVTRECPITRVISATFMLPDETGQYTAQLSGLALTVCGWLFRTDEELLPDGGIHVTQHEYLYMLDDTQHFDPEAK